MSAKSTVWRNPTTGAHVQVHDYSIKGQRRVGLTLRDRNNANGIGGPQTMISTQDEADAAMDKLNAKMEAAGYERIDDGTTGQRGGRSKRVNSVDDINVPSVVKPTDATADAPKGKSK